jgi:hypothetical protein
MPHLLSWITALAASLWSLRGVAANNVVDTDAARHAMNGAFILDLVRHARILAPVEYAKWYFARYPAITIPYHPPGFPSYEAIFFALFGVKLFAARLAVAVSVGAVALLLLYLVRMTHGSLVLGLCAVICFFSLPVSMVVASDVMLEFPAMVSAIASVYFLHLMIATQRWIYSLAFAAFGALGIWTKQTVFLILMPFLYIILLRRWNLLRSKQVWISVAIMCGAGLALAAVGWSVGWSGISQNWRRKTLAAQLHDNFFFYLRWIRSPLITIPFGAWLTAKIAQYFSSFLRPRTAERKDPLSAEALYLAWIAAVLLILMAVPASDERYFFFAYPAVLVVALSVVTRIAESFAPSLRYAPAAIGTAWMAASGLFAKPPFLSGPAQAAAYVFENHARRVLYCGLTDGNFMFSLRTLDRNLDDSVIPCYKIPEDQRRPDSLPDFARRVDADYLIVEHASRPQPWDGTLADSNLSLERIIPQDGSQPRYKGDLSIYRVSYRVSGDTHPNEYELEVPISAFGRSLKPE